MGSNLRAATFEKTQITTIILGNKQIKTLMFSTLKQHQPIPKHLINRPNLHKKRRNTHNVLRIKAKYLNFAL